MDLSELARLTKENADLVAALTKLANEVEGILGLAAEQLRAQVGNTNVAVLSLRLDESRAALAKVKL